MMTTPAGWYPDAHGVMRYWDGRQWTSHVSPPPPPNSSAASTQKAMLWIGLALAAVGCGITLFTQVSVASGMGTVWVGLGVAIVGAVVAWVGGARTGVRILTVVLVIVAIASAIYDQHQIDQKRQEIQQILNNTP